MLIGGEARWSGVTRAGALTEEMWARIEPLLPSVEGAMGRPMRDHQLLVESTIHRYRAGVAWWDLPAVFGPWQTVWKRHHRFVGRRDVGRGVDGVAG